MLVEIDLENPKRELRPGMYATAKVGVERHSDTLLLPAEAVVFEKAGPSVFTVADGKAKKVAVKIGFNDGASVEILDGLAQDDSAILLGKMTLNNPVRVLTLKNVFEGDCSLDLLPAGDLGVFVGFKVAILIKLDDHAGGTI
jgi:multidrug efflux pump subunit AcrA (membrane-fusion protein)